MTFPTTTTRAALAFFAALLLAYEPLYGNRAVPEELHRHVVHPVARGGVEHVVL